MRSEARSCQIQIRTGKALSDTSAELQPGKVADPLPTVEAGTSPQDGDQQTSKPRQRTGPRPRAPPDYNRCRRELHTRVRGLQDGPTPNIRFLAKGRIPRTWLQGVRAIWHRAWGAEGYGQPRHRWHGPMLQ